MMNHHVRQIVLDALVERYKDKNLTAIVGLESRGYYFGIPLAIALMLPFIPVRKAGKLPGPVEGISYGLEYKEQEKIEIQKELIKKGDRVVILDDVLVTGGTAAAGCDLVKKCGADIVEVSLLIELVSFGGRNKIPKDIPVFSIVQYE